VGAEGEPLTAEREKTEFNLLLIFQSFESSCEAGPSIFCGGTVPTAHSQFQFTFPIQGETP
jgi:hypothetical protein